jgi:hypothetical protein
MPSHELSTLEFRELADVLKRTSAFQTVTDRKRLLFAALGGQDEASRAIRQFDLSGRSPVVAERLLRDLWGRSPGGRWAIARLADELLDSADSTDRALLTRLADRDRPEQSGAPRARKREAGRVDTSDRRGRLFIIHALGSPSDDKNVQHLERGLENDYDVLVDYNVPLFDQGWQQWASASFHGADAVLIAATSEWSKRATEFLRMEDVERYAYGHGVRYELKTLILPELTKGSTRRLLIVFFGEDDSRPLPPELQSLNQFLWPSDRRRLRDALHSIMTAKEEPQTGPAESGASAMDFSMTAAGIDATKYSRQPIVIAVEEATDQLSEDTLPGMERHLTVTLRAEQAAQLERLGSTAAASATTIADLERLGQEAWAILQSAEPRLPVLLVSTRPHRSLQPVAWTGYTPLLARIHRGIALASAPLKSTVPELVSISCGAHYFSPLSRPRRVRRINARVGATVPLDGDGVGATHDFRVESVSVSDLTAAAQADLTALRGAELAIVEGPSARSALDRLAITLQAPLDANPVTRVVIGLGDAQVGEDVVDRLLDQVPCVSLAGQAIAGAGLIAALGEALRSAGGRQAAPSIIAAIRQRWVTLAIDSQDVNAFRDGLFWSTWAWIGRPLFALEFCELAPAAYPHLSDLRTINSSGWYHERREGVARRYQAASLAASNLDTAEKFHLYLSGAGGTGKSCFLRSVFDSLEKRDDVLAVWHRIDAPSSDWEIVATRVKEECIAALGRKLGSQAPHPPDDVKLHDYLRSVLRTVAPLDITEVVVFLDQLERTFESGEQPNPERLRIISNEVMELLRQVRVGDGIRVFIASRKQYLPDFLNSWQESVEAGLQFNVLQPISERSDRKGFVDRVQNWCRRQHLVEESVTIDDEAEYELADKVSGHPLNMMLALIQLLSEHRRGGRITKALLEKLRPWEKLFAFDAKMMAQNDLDWFLLLAMAHARTEIVSLEEVWWRLRMVHPDLTREAEHLGKSGVLERLWLCGHLGRTIHGRQHDGDPTRFLEFFHANLRDYLLRDVMSYGVLEARASGGVRGTPAAWRALDRLWTAAHEWDQAQQLLAPEDVRALMEHRAIVIERVRGSEGSEHDAFYLLFRRDSNETRAGLCRAARECFVYSALAHEDAGRWAFEQIFPDVDARVECCRMWLARCGDEGRARIIEYLIGSETEPAWRYLIDVILGSEESGTATWRDIANLLAEPLLAARYRDGLIARVAERMGEEGFARQSQLERLKAFALQACGGDRDDLVSLLARCAVIFHGHPRDECKPLGRHFKEGSLLPEPAAGDDDRRGATAPWLREAAGRPVSKVQLVAGTALAGFATQERLDAWRQDLSQRIGVPLPLIALGDGELPSNFLELRINGQRIGSFEVYPGRESILKRHWHERHDFEPTDVKPAWDDVRREGVLWLEPDYLRQIGWHARQWTAESALLEWLEEEIRSHAESVIDLDAVSAFLKESAAMVDVRSLFIQFSLQDIVHIVRALVRDRVPFGSPIDRRRLLEELRDISGKVDADRASDLVRHLFRAELCRVHAARSGGCLFVVDVDPELEETLSSQRDAGLRLTPAAAHSLAAAVLRSVEVTLGEHDAVPIVACAAGLRLPLLRLLRRFDRRLLVLSTDDLSSDVPSLSAGHLTVKDLPQEARGRREAVG